MLPLHQHRSVPPDIRGQVTAGKRKPLRKELPVHRFLIVVALLVSMLPATALAGNESKATRAEKVIEALEKSGDRDKAFTKLSPDDKQIVIDYFSVATVEEVEEEPEMMLMASGCWQRSRYLSAENWAGSELWRYTRHLYWCGDGSWVTYWSSWHQVTTPGWWWEYKGEVGYNVLGGNWYNQVDVFGQGKFQYCPPEVLCFQTVYPWVEQIGYGWGDYWASSGK